MTAASPAGTNSGGPAEAVRHRTGPCAGPGGPGRCELCSGEVTREHRHLVDVEERVLACTCVACAMLFDRAGAGGRFRAVPDRFLVDTPWHVEAAAWEALRVPDGLALFFRDSFLDRFVALAPGHGSAAESQVDPDTWEAVFGGSPLARELAADVEALLVRRDGQRGACYLLPVDAAYDLVSRLRRPGPGTAAFLADLDRRATAVDDRRH